jgi:HD-GYP domain-containing protein (c-di-GMP phosphodiesterase class II)
MMREGRDTHFDPMLLDVFLDIVADQPFSRADPKPAASLSPRS